MILIESQNHLMCSTFRLQAKRSNNVARHMHEVL